MKEHLNYLPGWNIHRLRKQLLTRQYRNDDVPTCRHIGNRIFSAHLAFLQPNRRTQRALQAAQGDPAVVADDLSSGKPIICLQRD